MWTADLGNGRFRNPILYADYSDPDAIRVGDDYFMISSSFSNAPAMPLLHSKDLVNWKVVNYILPEVPEFRYRNPIHGCGVWAPAIRYHEGIYYVCFPMPDEGIYMTTATDPYGKWSRPVNIRPGAGWIDPCPFWDDDGKAYLVAGVAKSRIGYKSVLHMVEMKPDGSGLTGEEKVIFDGNLNDQITIEGPKMYKRNGWYYIFAPAGGVKTGWQTVLRSKNVFGPYEYKVVMRQGDSPVNGPHQGAWVDTVTGQDWFIHFQDVYAAGRITHLQPMSWDNDWPVIGVRKGDEDYGEPVMEYEKPDVGAEYDICEPDTTDEFTGESLGLQWQWNANPDNDWAEYGTDKDGRKVQGGSYIRLNAVPRVSNRPIGDYRNLLLQKWPAPEFTCEARINISGMKPGDNAGYVSLGRKYIALDISKSENGKINMYAVTGIQQFDCDQAYTSEDRQHIGEYTDIEDVYFRYTVKRIGTKDHVEAGLQVKNAPEELITIEVSTDGKQYTNPVSVKAEAGRWVGVKSGLYASHDNGILKNESGYITADYVRYTD